MEKKKSFSFLKFLIVLLCLVLIAFSVAVNLLFSGGKIPKILDNYIYIVKESDNMGTMIDPGAALISPDARSMSIAKGDIVLCRPADAPDQLSFQEAIYNIDIDDDGISQPSLQQMPHRFQVSRLSQRKVSLQSVQAIPSSAELGKAISLLRH